jgi:hypothetical protein
MALFRSELARRGAQYAAAAEHLLLVLPQDLRARGGEDLVRLVYAALGESRQAPQALACLRALRSGEELPSLEKWPMILMTLCWYTWLGALDDAYAVAQRIVDAFKRTGILSVVNVGPLWMPEMIAFRRDARFQDFVRALGLIDYWRERGPPEGCELKGERLLLL